MKIHKHLTKGLLAAAGLLLAGSLQLRAATNFTVAAFATGTQGENNTQDGTYGQYNGDNLSVPYGAGTIAWDGITYDAADGSTGSAHITANFSSANNQDLLVSIAPGYNNWYYEGASGSCPSGTVDFTQYSSIQFDILWDTNSTLSINQFNTGSNWPSSYLISGVGSNYMATNSYYTGGANIDLFTGSGGTSVYLGHFLIPTNAATGWQTVTVPYSDTLAGISAGAGLWFSGSFGGGSGISGGPYTAAFWIDKLTLVANVVPVPPPTLAISTASPGLHLFTASGAALNNRESLKTVGSNYTWVGASGPVSYSFTVSSYPVPAADQVGNYLFLIPNPGTEVAPDYNEPNLMFLDLETSGSGATQVSFRYKTNQPNGNGMIYGAGTLATIYNSSAVGTYTLTFNHNTNVTMTTPSGASTNFNIPDGTGATSALFASNVVVYLGTEANNAGAENDHTVISDFNITGLGAANFNDNFIADAGTLNTNLWLINASSSQCVRMVAPGNPYYISYTLPSSGFTLQAASSLSGSATTVIPSSNTPFTSGSHGVQLINTNDLPPGKAAFFSMVKRTFSKLLILLPGETSAPGTPTGKTGTPTQQNTENLVNVTVLAVDSQYYPISGITDTIQLGSSDGGAILPNSAAMSNGSVTFTTFLFQTDGTQTITATDLTNTNIPTATSSSVVVAN